MSVDDADDPLMKPASEVGFDEAARAAEPAPSVVVEPAAVVVEPAAVAGEPAAVAGELAEPLAKIDAAIAQLEPKPEPPLLPAKYDENDLRAAVGARPIEPRAPRRREYDEDGDAPRPRSRKAIAIVALAIAGVLGILALVFLGRINRDRYLLACEPERAVPEQGRAFPPWGMRALEGAAWRPLKIAPETRCQPHATDDVQTLNRAYLIMILDQVTVLLSAREVTRVDDADALLKQALLLTRPPAQESEALASERAEHRKEVDRMLGDVTYWRATARLRDAASALTDAARQFEAAAAAHPRHVSDAPAWATHAHKLAGELKAGPGALAGLPGAPVVSRPAGPPADKADKADRTDHGDIPVGVALPVDADRPAATPGAAAPPPDAGVPVTGGVLL